MTEVEGIDLSWKTRRSSRKRGAEDREAFEAIVKRYEKKVFHLAYSFVQDRASADDLAQDIFVKMYFSLPKFHFKSEFGTWLYRIAVNHIKDHLRKVSRRKEVSLEEFEEMSVRHGRRTRAKEREEDDAERTASRHEGPRDAPSEIPDDPDAPGCPGLVL